MKARVPMNLDSVMTPEPAQADAIPAAQALAPSLRVDAAKSVTEPTAAITVRIPLRVRDGLATLKARTGRSAQELVQFALERLLADNGIE